MTTPILPPATDESKIAAKRPVPGTWRAPTPLTEEQVKRAEAGLQRAWNRLHGATVRLARRRSA